MTFLQPFILFGLPLVLVPVLIHFLNRMRYRTVAWAAMMFLLTATRQSVRHAKLREILLLICRMAAVLFLIFFLARPLAGGWLGWAFHGAPDTVVLLIDRSPSMELHAQQDQPSKRVIALRRLAEAGRALEGRTRFVLIDSATRKATEISSLSFLNDLPQTQPSDASADIPDLLQAAVDYVAANQSGRTEFWLASDLQVGDWQPENAARWAEVAARINGLPQDVRVRLLAEHESGTDENVSVEVAEARRRKVGAKTELLLTIDLSRTGQAPIDLPLTVNIEGSRSVVNVHMEGQQLRFQHKVDLGTRTSRGWGSVESPADANPRDNVSYFVFDGEHHLHTLVAANDPIVGRVMALAAAPAPDLLNESSSVISPLDFPPRDMTDVALVIMQGGEPDRLRSLVDAGGIALALPSVDAGEDNDKRITNWRGNEGPLAMSDEGEELPVRELAITRRVTLTGKGTALATFADGKPLLTREQIGKGYLYTLATLPQHKWSTLSEGTVLVPLVQRLVREGGHRLGAVVTGTCGVEPMGEARRVDKDAPGFDAGIYQRQSELVALNRPASEDVREFADGDVVKALFGSVQVRVFEEKEDNGKLAGEIWRLFVWVMLAVFLIGEAILTYTPKPIEKPVTTKRPAHEEVPVSNSPFSFSASIPLVGIGVIIWAGFGWLGVVNWRRNHSRKSIAALEFLRFCIAGLVVMTLWKPEMKRVVGTSLQPTVAVLWDASRSMTTRDVVEGDHVITRQEAIEEMRALPVWKALSNEVKVINEDFSAPSTNDIEGTDINAALDKVAGSGLNLRAVMLFSDGDWNLGSSPVAAATRLRSQGVPVYTVGLGSEKYLPDVALERVTAPEYGLLGEQVYVGFTLTSHMDQEIKTTVTLRDNHGGEVKKAVIIPAQGAVQDAMFWTSLYEGTSKLTLSIPPVEGASRSDNKEQQFEIAIRKEILKVLIVESQPRWEYRYLRNALQRDPGIDVKCVLFHPGLQVGAGRDYIPGIPQTKEGLSQFDVVFLGDVGIGDNELTPDDATNLVGLVEQQASGLVFLPGRRGRIISLAKSALGELLPVDLDSSDPTGTSAAEPSRLVLTQHGRGHLLTMLATTEEGNAELWKNLPGFYWYAPVRKSKGGSDVLAVHELARNEWGRIPLLVTRQQGNGKVLFMGTDGAWRWRRGVEDTYHYRFWGQVVRWMAYQRHLAQEQGMRVFFTPENPKRGGTVHLNATVFDNSGLPLRNGRVNIEVTTPKGQTERLEMHAISGDWGVFESEMAVNDQGDYKLKAHCETTGRDVTTTMPVRGEDREQVGRPAQLEVMREIARITQGDFGAGSNLEAFAKQIQKLPEHESAEQRIRLWCHPVWGGLIVLLLTIYWTGRKLAGMV